MARWTPADSEELYAIPSWGLGLFGVNDQGHVVMRPEDGKEIDLKRLVDDLVKRGIEAPILVRFTDVLRARLTTLATAFEQAIADWEYAGAYRGVYPIKVNQNRHIVEDLVRFAEPHHIGLECGSKPELLVVLAMLEDPEALIVCNGYKDRPFLEMALIARKLGRNTIIVVEQPHELDVLLEVADELGIDPVIGVRAKLSTQGVGRWKASSGENAKFGLDPREMVALVRALRKQDRLDSLQLLHFHIGSQVSAIRNLKNAVNEAARIYVELARMGAGMRFLDVGGGLGIDYDGSRTNFSSSMNYDTTEYASTVVSTVKDVCDAAEQAHPTLITEAGRAMVAHGSMLVVPVIDVSTSRGLPRPKQPTEDDFPSVQKLWDAFSDVTAKDPFYPYHEALAVREDAITRFNYGLCSLEERAAVDAWFWTIAAKIKKVLRHEDELPEDLENLDRVMADTYFCNFSVFQSIPDSWAIKQLFPVVPLHRLDEEPKRRGILVDMTCDSDGKIDKFIDRRDVKSVLELHAPDGEPYYLGLFLVGAYQEILGDLHNLFGDTNAVHVSAARNERGYRVDSYVEGDRVVDVLKYVQFDRSELLTKVRRTVEAAYEADRLSVEEGTRLLDTYVRQLAGYTYLS